MGGQLVEAVQVIGSETAVQAAAEALGGLDGVLGDVLVTGWGAIARTEDQAHQVVLDLINESRP